MYADTHNMNTAYHTHTSFTHTHINSLTHTHTTHIHHLHTYIHINSPTIAFPSLSYFLFPCSLTHSLTHSLTPSLTHSLTFSFTHLCMRIHTHIHKNSPTITPPSLLYFLFPSCFSMLSLSLEKLVTCGVFRSYNCIFGLVNFFPSPATSRGSNPSSVRRLVPPVCFTLHPNTAEHEAK